MSRVPRKGLDLAGLTLIGWAWAMAGPAGAEGFPVVGGFGFALSQPSSASCRQIDQAVAAQFTECEYLSTGQALGLTFPFHSCQASGGGDVLIYATRAQCEEALNTMKANAP